MNMCISGDDSESNRYHWIVAECPARLDLSGGWSDTPPLTLENKEGEGGGRVTNVAILIDQKRPIGAKGIVTAVMKKALSLKDVWLESVSLNQKMRVCHLFLSSCSYCLYC